MKSLYATVCAIYILLPAMAFGQLDGEMRPSSLLIANSHNEDDGEPKQDSRSMGDERRSDPEHGAPKPVGQTARKNTVKKSTDPQSVDPTRNEKLFAGGKLSVNVATFGGRDADGDFIESTYSLGFSINLFARFAFTKHWSIQSELAYATRGTGVVLEGKKKSPFKFSYSEFVIVAHAQRALSRIHERMAVHALFGPSIGYLLSAERDQMSLTDISSIDFGIHGGVGLSLAVPFGAPVLEIRYYYGIRDLDKTQRDVSHRAFSIFLGYEALLPF